MPFPGVERRAKSRNGCKIEFKRIAAHTIALDSIAGGPKECSMMAANDRLQKILAALPPHLRDEVASYAQYLLEKNELVPDGAQRPRFYICPICFSSSKVRLECHGRPMISCNADNPEDCKPPMTADGELKARAPRWFVSSVADED